MTNPRAAAPDQDNLSSEGPAAKHWRTLVERRRQQMDAAYAKLSRSSVDYWQRRLGAGSQLRRPAAENDPLLQRILQETKPETSVLDVGAGAGRYSRVLARHVRQVTAVEPDATMLRLLTDAVTEDGLSNVHIVRSGWLEASAEPADLTICAHVLYPIANATAFLRKLDAHATHTCFLALRQTAPEPEPLNSLWQKYHGEPRYLQPGFLDAYNLLCELGIYADVKIVPSVRSMWSFDSLDHAVDAVREHLILPAGAETDAELRRELDRHLVPADGRLTLPASSHPSAILWWTKTVDAPPAD